jgi:hypothetical protein
VIFDQLDLFGWDVELAGLVFFKDDPGGNSFLSLLSNKLPFSNDFIAFVFLSALDFRSWELEPFESFEFHTASLFDEFSELLVFGEIVEV